MRQQQTPTNKKILASQYILLTMFGSVRRTSALVHGQKVGSLECVLASRNGNAPLIAHLMTYSSPMLNKILSTAGRATQIDGLSWLTGVVFVGAACCKG